MSATAPRFNDRLVAEAVRVHEDRLGHPVDEPEAWQHGRDAAGDLEARLVARAGATRLGLRVRDTLGRWRRNVAVLLGFAVLLAFLAGVLTAIGVFGVPGPGGGEVNVFVVLAGLLGLQLAVLLVWLLMVVLRPGRGGGWLGARVMGVMALLTRRLSPDDPRQLLAIAAARLTGERRLGAWAASTLTHALWAAFCIGALLTCMLALAVRQYDFVWGTTLLDAPHFIQLVGWLGTGPALLGFPVPDEALVRASRLGADVAIEARRPWAGLVLGALLVYGLVPRVVLGLACFGLARRAAARFRLDLSASAYALAAPRVTPTARRMGVIDPERAGADAATGAVTKRVPAAEGPVAVAMLEPGPDVSVAIPDAWVSLGAADDRASRERVIEALRARAAAPRVVVVVAWLARTPDRGARSFLRRLRDATRAPVWLVLAGAGTARARDLRVASRIDEWARLAGGAAIDRVLAPQDDADCDDLGARVEAAFVDAPGSGT